MKNICLILLTIVVLSGCSGINENDSKSFQGYAAFTELGDKAWKTGFSDCPQDTTGYKIKFKVEKLPSTTKKSDKSILVSGNNHSDDLWMFVYQKLSGLKPDTKYEGSIKLSLASKYLDGSVGIGGSPANSVYLKAGLVNKEPEYKLSGGNYVFNLDKGNQSQSGTELKAVGDLAISGSKEEYKLILRELNNYSFTSNSKGECWIVAGFDSGFEGTTSIYLHNIYLNFSVK